MQQSYSKHDIKAQIGTDNAPSTYIYIHYCYNYRNKCNKKLSWCWQTRATRLEVSQGRQT